jgi:hypothetical protein
VVPGSGDQVQSAPSGQAGAQVECPPDLTGLVPKGAGLLESNTGGSSLTCDYVFPRDPVTAAARASVTVYWSEAGPSSSWQGKCGLPEDTARKALTAEGTLYSSQSYVFVTYNGDRKYADPMRRFASRLLAAAEVKAYPCGGASTPTPAPTTTSLAPGETVTPVAEVTPEATRTAASSAGRCDITGRVTDVNGSAVRGLHVQLVASEGAAPVHVSTDQSGKFRIDFAGDAAGAAVSLVPEEYGHSPNRFKVFYGDELPELALTPAAGANPCERNFDLWNIGEGFTSSGAPLAVWPDLVQIYQNTWKAWALADLLGAELDYGLPLEIHAWCDVGELLCDGSLKADFAFYRGSTHSDKVDEPYIALGHASSVLGARGVPDNREYHEFGHAFFADVFGDYVPVVPGDRNHGGYYANGASTDSWVEGFAEFYSMMVAKHIDRDLAAHRYRIGAEYDLEVDHKPWEAGGWWEEFTVAGLLLDLEDGTVDYQNVQDLSAFTVTQNKLTPTPTGLFAVGKVKNGTDGVVENMQVTVDFKGKDGATVFTQVTTVLPRALKPGGEGAYYAVAPQGKSVSSVTANVGPLAVTDDDPADLNLKDIIAALSEFGSENDGTQVSSVSDLYQAISTYFAEKDRNGDGAVDVTQADIDKMFLAHGLFEDLDGDQKFTPADGKMGLTSHPGRRVNAVSYEDYLPRHDSTPHPGSLVPVDTGDVKSTSIVQIEYPADQAARSYAYAMEPGSTAPVELAAPAEGQDTAITVITVADDHLPSVAMRITGDAFHSGLTNTPSKPFLSAKVRPVEGKVFDDDPAAAPASEPAPPPAGQGGVSVDAPPEGFGGGLIAAAGVAVAGLVAAGAGAVYLAQKRKVAREKARKEAEEASGPPQEKAA